MRQTIIFSSLLLLLAGCSESSLTQRDQGADLSLSPIDQRIQNDHVELRDFSLSDISKDELYDISADQQSDPDQASPTLNNLTLVVNLGDSLAAGVGVDANRSYRSLLVNNDDQAYPGFKGMDLHTHFPNIQAVDHAISGSTTSSLVDQLQNVPDNLNGNTLVVISSGGNDFKNKFYISALTPSKIVDVAQAATANIQKVIDHFADKSRYPHQTTIVLFRVHDPTDGEGGMSYQSGMTKWCFAFIGLGLVGGQNVLAALDIFNQHYLDFAQQKGIRIADNYSEFLGHGVYHDDPTNAYYDSTDPSAWFQSDCLHANERGHHEMRRLIWQQIQP